MERNPTVRAMEWSVELEKGLRSKTPLRRAQAISDFGPKLLQWSRNPHGHSLSPAAHHLFDLIPGEDSLFGNTVLLRLADAFRLSDRPTRVCVVEVFLAEYRERKKRKSSGGLLSKGRVKNCSELLGRVKDVYHNGGDVESRSMALCLFGCWAGFAAESSNVRYLVLSSMVSSHASEAKAALFAGGCFCDASDDFTFIFLEMLLNLMTSCEILPPVKLAAAHVYAKLGNSYSTATKSYKAGLKMLLDSSEEDFQVALMISLSKIASRSSTLTSDQVNLLVSLLRQEKKSQVRATALRCLLYIFSKGVSQLSLQIDILKDLFNMLDEPDLPTNMHCDALRILSKIILYTRPCPPCDILDLGKLTTLAENAFVSGFTSTSLLALRVQVDISKRCKVRKVSDPSALDPFRIPQQAVMLILRQITSLVNSLIDQADSVKFQKISQLFNLLLSVVQEDQGLALPVLDQLVVLVRHLDSDFMDTTHAEDIGQNNLDAKGEEKKSITSKLLCNVYRFLVSSLECLNEAGTITMHVFDGVKRLVETVCDIKLQDRYISSIYSMLLLSSVLCGHNMNKNNKSCTVEANSHNHLVEQELIMLELTKRILAEKSYWDAYKVGRYLACQGAWFSSSLIFKHLIMQVSSDSCRCWLIALFNFACSGGKATLMFPAEKYSSLADMAEATKLPLELVFHDLEEISYDGTDPFYKLSCSKVVLSAYRSICSAKEALEVDVTPGKIFCFQRWIFSLRAKTLRAVVDILEILETIPFLWEENSTSWTDEKNSVVQCLSLMGQVSLRLKRLAKEFDLLGSSFIDMDSESSKCISALVLAVSLLGFITSFPSIFEISTGLKNSKDSLFGHVVQNLAGRLWYTDPDTSTKLCHLIDDDKDTNKSGFRSLSRNQPSNVSSGAGDILGVCRYAASEISCLRSKVDETEDGENTPRIIQDGLRLTLKLLDLWIRIPFTIPKCFFRIRPCIGTELFAVSVNKNPDAICVSKGYRLSLSVCLQLRNVASNIPFRPAKLHCILYSSTSFQEPSQAQDQGWESNEFVEMNEKLFHHVKNGAARNTNSRKISSSGNSDCGFVSSFICCEPNEVGQGFSSCLLDVSRFPLGSYVIKWQCCCIDDGGKFWNLLPVNAGPVFTVK